jgi:crotonobetainyl-CoA:carnitine CoA-transferase CaiB-like acyl-CoA transferase
MPGALDGIRVIDLSQMIASPYCTQMLADLGADVIKVERPGIPRDGFSPSFERDGEQVSISGVFLGHNRNKRAVALDLSNAQAKVVLEDLLRTSDVVVENYSHRTRTMLGVTEEWGWSVRPELVWASLTGLGRTGPEAHRNGWDYLAQARGGWMSITGEPDGPPMKAGNSLVDYYAGLHLCVGIMAALRHRERTGEGQLVDVSLLDSIVPVLDGFPMWHSIGGIVTQRNGHFHPIKQPGYAMFSCKDGDMVLGAAGPALGRLLEDVMQRPDLLDVPQFVDMEAYTKFAEGVIVEIRTWMGQRTREEAGALLDAQRVPFEPVRDLGEIWDDPQLQARNMFWEYDYPPLGKIKTIGSPLHLSKTPVEFRMPPPASGEHNFEVLQEVLGYDDERVAELAVAGVFEVYED